MTFSALGGQDFSVSCHLVRRGNLGLLQAHTLDSDTKTILSLGARSFITIEKCLGTNIRQSIVKKPFLAIISENAIEGLDVWVHGQLKGGICRVVFWRVLEEVLTPQGVILVIPFCTRCRWSHCGGLLNVRSNGTVPGSQFQNCSWYNWSFGEEVSVRRDLESCD